MTQENIVEKHLGVLSLPSRALVLGDPQYLPSLEILSFTSERVSISARLLQYPTGEVIVTQLKLEAQEGSIGGPIRKVGDLAIDSARVVAADKLDLKEHWTETGKDRIGVISTARDDALLRNLTKRFRLKTVRKSGFRAEVVGPVSEQLERDIVEHLKSIPQYAAFPFIHFRVETNNSFDRVNSLETAWGFLPIGNDKASPTMFACSTGWGDGTYSVMCQYLGDTPVVVTVSFVTVSFVAENSQ